MLEVATGETKKGVFGKEKPVTRKEKQRQQTGWSDCRVDGPRLAIDVQKAIDELNAENYEIIGVTDITSEIGSAHVCTPVTNAPLVCRLLLEKTNIYTHN